MNNLDAASQYLDDSFMHKRPARGKAFFCLADASALLSIKVCGDVDRQSNTNNRAISILLESGLIEKTLSPTTPYRVTDKGDAVVDVIRDITLPS